MPQIVRTQLLYLLERNELEELFEHLKEVCRETKNQPHQDMVLLFSSRYNHYLHERENQLQDIDNLLIEFNQIKFGLQNLIKTLDLEDGTLTTEQKKRKYAHGLMQQMLKSNWRWSVVSALVSIVLIGLGQLRISSAELEMSARVSQFGMHTNEEWRIGEGQNLILKHFETDVIQNASFLPAEAISSTGGPVSMLLDGHSRLDALFIPAPETVTLISEGADLIIRVSGGPIQGTLQVQNCQIESREIGFAESIGTNEGGDQIEFTSDLNPSFYLSPADKDHFALLPSKVDSVGFFRLSFDKDSSTIKTAKLSIEGIQTELNLGDRLGLSSIKNGELSFIHKNGDLELTLKGSISKAKINQRGKSKSLMPTWLMYLQQNQSIAFYAGIFAALFGFFYPLRKEFFSKT